MHHAACIVDAHAQSRFLLMVGGVSSRMLQEHMYVLDTVTMRWSKFYTKQNLAALPLLQDDAVAQGEDQNLLEIGVKRMNGVAMTPRSGHSIVSMTDNLTFSRSEEPRIPKRDGSTSVKATTLSSFGASRLPGSETEHESGERKGVQEDADTHRVDIPVDADVMMVVFGGYGRSARTCHNDVHVICARPSLTSQAYRERILKKVPSSENDAAGDIPVGAAYDPCYEYSWRNELSVSQTRVGPPAARLAHSATLLHPPKELDAWGLRSVMVVFGGVGAESIFNDVHCLDVSGLNRDGDGRTRADTSISDNFEWVEVVGQGDPPPHRYGHTATAIDSNTIVVCGGISDHPLPLDSLYLLHLERVERMHVEYTRTVCHFAWSQVIPQDGVPPCPRSRHSALRVRTCSAGNMNGHSFDILVFGGSTMMENRPLLPEDSTATDRNVHALSVRRHAAEGRWSFEWHEMNTSFQKVPLCLSSNLVISPSTLGTDLASILSSGSNSAGARAGHNANIWFAPSDERASGIGGVGTGVGAHKFMLAVRSDRFRAMMSSGMKESTISKLPSTMARDILVEFFHFLYSDNISQQALGDPDMMMRLLVVANEYTISRLARLCEGRILRMLVPENAAAFLEVADLYGLNVSDGLTEALVTTETEEGTKQSASSEVSGSSKSNGVDGSGHVAGAGKAEEEGEDKVATAEEETVVSRRQYGESVSKDDLVQRSNSILREGCMSFVLRHYKEVEGTEEFMQLPPRLKMEVERRRTEFVNVYSAE